MLGAKSALAADIDPNCASVVKSNAEKNNIDKDKIEVLSGNIITDEKLRNYIAKNKYPLIYANIVADVIIGILPLVKKCIADDGIFITSGIIEDRVDDVKKALKENGGVIGANKPQSRHDTTPRFKFEKDADGKPIFPPEFLKMKEEHDKLNVPQGQGIVDWKAVKAAADAQCDNVIYVVEREASYNDPQDRVACLAEDIAWLKANL